mgnify:FL=1
MRLTIELIPAGSWGANLRSLLTRGEWDRLRKHCYAEAGHVCEICGGTGLTQNRRHAVEAHEIWEYDDENRIQRLVGLQALCPLGHACKHMGLSISRGGGHRAIEHFRKVNDCDLETAQDYINLCFAIHAHRSIGAPWTLDLSWLRDAVALTPRDHARIREMVEKNEGVYMEPPTTTDQQERKE